MLPEEWAIDMKFVIVPEGFSHSRTFTSALSVTEVKALIEQDLRIPVANMKLFFNGQGAPEPTCVGRGCRALILSSDRGSI